MRWKLPNSVSTSATRLTVCVTANCRHTHLARPTLLRQRRLGVLYLLPQLVALPLHQLQRGLHLLELGLQRLLVLQQLPCLARLTLEATQGDRSLAAPAQGISSMVCCSQAEGIPEHCHKRVCTVQHATSTGWQPPA
jgi:hypothetical protein